MAIPKTMQAWRKHRGNPEAVYEEIPVPSTPANGFLIKVLAAGLCHSDVNVVARDRTAPHRQEKFVIGHEGCGEIVEIGYYVTGNEWKKGMRVALNPVPGCGKDDCDDCSNGLMQLCERGPRLGLGHDGSFAEYIAVPTRCCIPVPGGIKDAEAAVSTDAIMTSHHAIVRRAQITKDDTVFLFGLGGLGFNALQILLHIGCRFFVSETRQEPIDEAMKLGVSKDNIVPIGANIPEWVNQQGLENKIDVVVDIVGVEQTFNNAQVIGKSLEHVDPTTDSSC
jgi:propanol-preferring alcohol dehydrogenase